MKVIGNVYEVQTVGGDDRLFLQDAFVAPNAKEAIRMAEMWVAEEYPSHAEDVVIGGVKRIVKDVIQ